jgi:hypothetical protein
VFQLREVVGAIREKIETPSSRRSPDVGAFAKAMNAGFGIAVFFSRVAERRQMVGCDR